MKTFKSVTDSRLVIDIPAAGYGKDDIAVSTALRDQGETFILTVKGKYKRPTGATGKLVPRLAYDKVIDEKFKVTETFDTACDYNLEALKWSVKNGVIRISIPKNEEAIGKKVAPAGDDENINATAGAASVDTDDDEE